MRRSSNRVALAVLFSSAIVVLPTAAAAQSGAGQPSLSGSVLDISGAVISRPVIVVRHESSGLEHVVDAAVDGTFLVRRLAPGRYVVTITAPGFAVATRGVNVPADEHLRVILSPAPIVEQVTVVSAARQEELRDTLNTRVDVVPRSRIEETGGHETVGEILRELPGVVTRRGSESAEAAGEQIQGIDSRQVLVLIDGQPVVGARGIKRGGTLNLDRQSSARLERVEVVKGAASALYGSDAIGGVINLITREPSAPLEVAASLAGGSLGVVDARIEAGFKRSQTFGLFSLERHQQDGFDLTPRTFDTTGAPFRRYDALGKVHQQLAPSVAIRGMVTGYHNRTGGRSLGELGPQEDDIRDASVSGTPAASWLLGSSTTVEARGYYSEFSERSDGRLAPPRSTPLARASLEQRLEKIDLAATHTLGARQMLQAGVEWARDHYEGTNRVRDEAAGHDAETGIVWAQHRWSATDRLTTTAGVRVDRRSRFETAVSPKLGANFRVTNDLRLRASYGRGFRAPDLGQLYYRFLSPSSFYQVIGNPALQPEFAHSWQAGGDYTLPGRRARFGVNVFVNDVRDLIESVSLGFVATPAQLSALLAREGLDPSYRPALGRLLFTYRNVSDVVTQGLEFDTEAALTTTLAVGGAYTLLSARDSAQDLALTGRHRHHGHARISWTPAGTGLRAAIRGTFFSSWIAARTIAADGTRQDVVAPRFALWDAFISKRLGRGLSAFAALDNLADSQDPNTAVVLPDGAPAPIYRPESGRTARFGLRWAFSR